MDISKNTTRTYVVTNLPASSPADVSATIASGQAAMFNSAGKSDAATSDGAYFLCNIDGSKLSSNLIKKEWLVGASYKQYVAPVKQVSTLTVVLPESQISAVAGDYFSFMVMQDPGSVPSSINAVFPMAAYTADGGETATQIASALAKQFNVSVSLQFDAPIVATASGAVVTLTAGDKQWDLYQKPYKMTTFRVTEINNVTKVNLPYSSGQGVGKAVAELEELTYGYSNPERPWSAGANGFTPHLLANANGTYDMMTIQFNAKEFVTEATIIPTTYILAIDSTIAKANKNALIATYNLLLGLSAGDPGYIAALA